MRHPTESSQAALETTFKSAEEAGLKLAIRGRFVALLVLGTAIIFTRDGSRTHDFLLLFAAFGLIGGAHYQLIGSTWDRPWVKYVVVTLDIAVICYALSVGRLHDSADVPQYMVFRTNLFPFMFLFLGVSAFSFSPGLILWAGCAISIGWMSVFLNLTSGIDNALEWAHVQGPISVDQYLAVVLDQKFIATGSRVQELGTLMVTAAILSGVMYRARNTVLARLQAEEERQAVARVFGQYVPAEGVISI